MNASCTGCSASPSARPSIVVTSSRTATASSRQELARRPPTSTVHAPHCPWSQPFLAPVSASSSRRTSSSVARVSTPIACRSPLIVSVRSTRCASMSGTLPPGVRTDGSQRTQAGGDRGGGEDAADDRPRPPYDEPARQHAGRLIADSELLAVRERLGHDEGGEQRR